MGDNKPVQPLTYLMKTKGLLILPLGIWAVSVSAQPLTLDENGHGTNTILGLQPGLPVPFQVGPDPSGGIIGQPVLMYSIGYRVYQGDVALMGNFGASDLIRFYTPAGGTNSSLIIFYSENDGDGALADVGLPFSSNPILLNENNPDPVWRPNAGQPGAPLPGQTFPVGAAFLYVFLSEIPEPRAADLLLVFGSLWLAERHYRQRQSRQVRLFKR
jgi:hypothetical protein